jgi:hypothetical protein
MVVVIGMPIPGFDYYGADWSRPELAMICQNTGMADVYGPMGNPQLMSANSITCSIYVHAVGSWTWSYAAYGTISPGGLWSRPAASCGNSTGCWTATVNLSGGGTFIAWIN